MGVKNLWKVLEPVKTSCSLTDLHGKTVAVDLSGWIVESGLVITGQQKIARLHVKTLFWRISHMLRNGIRPVFVLDGAEAPAVKQSTLERRAQMRLNSPSRISSPIRSTRVVTPMSTPKRHPKPEEEESVSQSCSQNCPGTPRTSKEFERQITECCELLGVLGLPYVVADGEAEALCAQLCQAGIVDGVITNDGDALVYGAKVVYKNFTCEEKKFEPLDVYRLSDIESRLRLDQVKLVALAILCGCDYYEGVNKVGKETALQFLKMKDVENVLDRMKEWKTDPQKFDDLEKEIPKKKPHCSNCGHVGAHKQHKVSGCDMCATTSACTYSAPEATKYCTCEWHAHPKYRYQVAEVKIRTLAAAHQDFPPEEVISTFLHPPPIPAELPQIVWKKPRLEELKRLLVVRLSLHADRAAAHLVQLLAAYVMAAWSDSDLAPRPLITPSCVVARRTRHFQPMFEVHWETSDGCVASLCGDLTITTLEDEAAFTDKFPSIVEKFEQEQEQLKMAAANRKSRVAQKRRGLPNSQPGSGQKKISDMFKAKKANTPRSSKKASTKTAASSTSRPLTPDICSTTTSSPEEIKEIIKEVVTVTETSRSSSGKTTPSLSPLRGSKSRTSSVASSRSSRSRSPRTPQGGSTVRRLVTPSPSSRASTPTSISGRKKTPVRGSRSFLPKEFAQRVIRVDKRTKFRPRVEQGGEGKFAQCRKRLFPDPGRSRKRLNFGSAEQSMMDDSLEVEMSGIQYSDEDNDEQLMSPSTVYRMSTHRSLGSAAKKTPPPATVATASFYGSPDRRSRLSCSTSLASNDGASVSRSASIASVKSLSTTSAEVSTAATRRSPRGKASRPPAFTDDDVIVLDVSPTTPRKQRRAPQKGISTQLKGAVDSVDPDTANNDDDVIIITDTPVKSSTPSKSTAGKAGVDRNQRQLKCKSIESDKDNGATEDDFSTDFVPLVGSTSTPAAHVDLTPEECPPPSSKRKVTSCDSTKGSHAKSSTKIQKSKSSSTTKSGQSKLSAGKSFSGMKKTPRRRLLLSDEKTPSVKKFFSPFTSP